MIRRLLPFPLLSLLLLAGCATAPGPLRPIGESELESLLSSAKNPRDREGIVTYTTAAGPYYQNANRVHPGRHITLRMRGGKQAPGRPLFTAEGRVPGTGVNVLLDTSSRESWLALDRMGDLEAAPIKPVEGVHPQHVKLAVPGYAALVQRLRLKEQEYSAEEFWMECVTAYVPPAHGGLDALARGDGAAKGAPLFVMGASALEGLSYVRIDYPARRIRFSSAVDKYLTPKGFRRVAETALDAKRGHNFSIRGRFDESAELKIAIDTAGAFAASIPATEEEMADPPRTVVIGGERLELGNGVQSHAQGGLPESFPPRLGWKFFSRYVLVLDIKGRRFILEEPLPEEEKKAAATDKPATYRHIRGAPAE
jgi:hypothetical protein